MYQELELPALKFIFVYFPIVIYSVKFLIDLLAFFQIAQLLEDVQRLQANLSKLQETSAAQVSRLEEQLEHRRQHIARLEARLDQQRDYEDLKREVRQVHQPLAHQGHQN